MNILAIIPARMNSSRFPGKPMKQINGKPMIEHVYRRAKKNKLLADTVVATCDNEIFDHIESIGGISVMTSDKHERATDRSAEALSKTEKLVKKNYDIVTMVQGDEPMMDPEMITESVEPLINNDDLHVTNLLGKIETKEEFRDKNCIKVVYDLNKFALYFSRQAIPTTELYKNSPIGKQVAIISFRKEFLFKYLSLPETPLEKAESVDMMRIIENGYKIKLVDTKHNTFAVDTKDDLLKVEKLMKNQ